jgi:hypothetical protein
MWRSMVVACLLALEPFTAFADDVFPCGGADVRFSFGRRTGGEEHVEAVITVNRDGRDTVLRYDGNVDFIGGVCAMNARSRPTVVFQAYCGGSGCRDLDNWGIVDPSDLRVRLVPNDWNRGDAEKTLGRPLPKIDHLISIENEARKLGLKW